MAIIESKGIEYKEYDHKTMGEVWSSSEKALNRQSRLAIRLGTSNPDIEKKVRSTQGKKKEISIPAKSIISTLNVVFFMLFY